MGGPLRYDLRDFALERIYRHMGLKPILVECFDGKAHYYSWAHILRKKPRNWTTTWRWMKARLMPNWRG